MTAITVNKEEFVERCGEVYGKNRDPLEREHKGRIVALYEDGVAAVGTSIDEACKLAEKRFPNRIFYVRRIGKYSAAAILF